MKKLLILLKEIENNEQSKEELMNILNNMVLLDKKICKEYDINFTDNDKEKILKGISYIF